MDVHGSGNVVSEHDAQPFAPELLELFRQVHELDGLRRDFPPFSILVELVVTVFLHHFGVEAVGIVAAGIAVVIHLVLKPLLELGRCTFPRVSVCRGAESESEERDDDDANDSPRNGPRRIEALVSLEALF